MSVKLGKEQISGLGWDLTKVKGSFAGATCGPLVFGEEGSARNV